MLSQVQSLFECGLVENDQILQELKLKIKGETVVNLDEISEFFKVSNRSLVKFTGFVQNNGIPAQLYLPTVNAVNNKTKETRKFTTILQNQLDLSEEWSLEQDLKPENLREKQLFYVLRLGQLENSVDAGLLVALYSTEALKLGQVVQVVGILEHPSDEDEQDSLAKASVLHAITVEPVTIDQSVQVDYDRLIEFMNKYTDNDGLLSSYLLCSLMGTLKGLQSYLNVSGCTKQTSRKLFESLKALNQTTTRIDLQLSSLNEKRYLPGTPTENEKYVGVDMVAHGILQVADQTVMFLDEVSMNEGKLNSQGVLNLTSIQRLINTSKIALTGEMQYDLDVDATFLVASEGKSMFSLPFRLPISKNTTASSSNSTDAEASVLAKMISKAKSMENYSVSDKMSLIIQNDYSNSREVESSNGWTLTNQFDLQRALDISKALCFLKGETSLTLEIWNEALEMERSRLARLYNEANSDKVEAKGWGKHSALVVLR